VKPFNAPTGTVWLFHPKQKHDNIDVFVILDGYMKDNDLMCRRVLVMHSDLGSELGELSFSEDSPYNDKSERFV